MIILLFILMLSFQVFASEPFQPVDYVTYFGTTDNLISFAWDAGEGANAYELRLHGVEQDIYIDEGIVQELCMDIQLPKTGHYIAEIRSIGPDGEVSEWVSSITIGTVDGVDRAWWLYGYPNSPGPIIIGND